MIDGINVVYLSLPDNVKATHTENEDGSHTIFIDERLSESDRWMAYLHELDHIKNGDLGSEEPAGIIEQMRRAGFQVSGH